MRKADFDVAWKEGRRPKLAQISVREIKLSLGEVLHSVNPSSRIAAFIGRNGVGKTGLLANVAAAVNGGELPSPRNSLHSISGSYRGNEFMISPGHKAPEGMAAEIVDASAEVHKVTSYLLDQTNINEFLVQYEPNYPNVAALGLYRYVTGLPYEKLGVRELEAPVAPVVQDSEQDDQVYPFFEVSVGSISYSSLTMGFGELCACLLIWRLLRADPGSIVLLDEPDAHLSPSSRRAFVDAMAYIAHERKLWIGFSTHSMELLEPLRDIDVFLVSAASVGARSRLDPIGHRRQAVRELGLAQARTLLISVEDVDAQAVVLALLHRWALSIVPHVDVVIVEGGADEVQKFVELFPKKARICKAIAVLDGDKRPEVKDGVGAAALPPADLAPLPGILYLPGSNDPIQAGRELVLTDSAAFSRLLGVPDEAVRQMLQTGNHVDHHDFLSYVVETLKLDGRTVHDIRYALVNCWLDNVDVAAEAKKIAASLMEILDKSLVAN